MTRVDGPIRPKDLPALTPGDGYLRVATVPRMSGGYVRLIGDLDRASVDLARVEIRRLVAAHRAVVVDLAPLSFCDAAGIGLFLEVTEMAQSIGHMITFARPRPALS